MLTAIDITEKYMLQKELEISHQRFEAVVNSAYEGIISVDKNQQIQLMNDAAKEMFGYSEADICKINLRSLIPKKYHDKHDGYVETFKQSPVKSRPMHQRSEVTGVRRDGSEFPVDITIAKIHVDDKLELTAVVRDLSEKLSLISELQKAASHDELTGIFNRRQLVIELEREFERYHRFGNGFSIALLDLDHFKSINDKLGHIAGDKVLQHFSENVKKELRSVDIFGRWGGEEFLLVLPEADMDKSQRILQRIKQRLQKEPFDSQDESIVIKFSAGLTTINTDTSTLESLIKKVDKALYQAKDEGRDRIVVAS
jgi:diguanylate cyclase (GGDEF)-like protein/PAS domain S-box-containing protein